MSGNSSVVKRAILQAYYPATQTADVLILEATSAFLTQIPIDNAITSASAIAGALAAVLFFDEHNPQDAVVISVYPNGSQGVPSSSAHGIMNFVTPAAGNSGFLVNSGNINTINMFGNGIPSTATAVLALVTFTSPTANARLELSAHNANLNGEMIVGNLYAANQNIWANGIIPVDVNGQVDVSAVGGNCTVTVWTYGYVS